MPNLRNGSKGGFEPGLTRLRVRHSTTELPRSTNHIVCTADAMSCVSKMEIVYSCIHSDHHPVLFCLDCDIVPEGNTSGEAGDTTKLNVHWNNLGPD